MYRLALRFLGHPDDAQDACQEILVRIVTHLGSFEGRSKFTTWAYTVAVHSLLRTRRRLVESSVQGAEAFAAFLDAGMGEVDPTSLTCSGYPTGRGPRSWAAPGRRSASGSRGPGGPCGG
jgi:DNA-directed RNA polymerase specialized sigma24 family protein